MRAAKAELDAARAAQLKTRMGQLEGRLETLNARLSIEELTLVLDFNSEPASGQATLNVVGHDDGGLQVCVFPAEVVEAVSDSVIFSLVFASRNLVYRSYEGEKRATQIDEQQLEAARVLAVLNAASRVDHESDEEDNIPWSW
jgi:hypothetical protein